MSNVSEKQRSRRAEKARLRSKRNQEAQQKKRPEKVARPRIEREAPEKPWKRPRLRFGSGGGAERARKRQEAQEAALKAKYPDILTKSERRAIEQKKRDEKALKRGLKSADLSKGRVPELRTLAQNIGIKGTSKMKKDELITAIKEKADE